MHSYTSLLAMAVASTAVAESLASYQHVNENAPVAWGLFPASRGTDSLVANVAPCQGYELAARVEYPITGGDFSWMSTKDIFEIELRYSTSSNPTAQSDFQLALNNITAGLGGQRCIQGPDFAGLGLEVGQNVTMQFYYQSGPQSTEHFECADLTLVSTETFTQGNWDTNCVNWVRSTQMRRDSVANPQLYALQQEEEAAAAAASNNVTQVASHSHNHDGLTATEAGLTGAFVTLGVVGIAFAASVCAGFVSFGKRSKVVAAGKPASFTSSTV